ncbi:MAG TPA: EVE domain-containing protein [Blastocatellia bacterium]|nr:EVE domain-containing protein [Blastocatellia bacterium]HMY71947.1 EVE domain-containing protein [Blastocatellia bacterium]HMZ20995.1 EVE domain-containing protein [Blastocatellia bacterium]HNG28817.1 EVE domain-containing protein [Blastocatellia bacterium]
MRYWLMKSEPTCFSIDDLAKAPKKTTCWDGVRNYQARNFMREMAKGDLVFFYHSNAEPPAIAGIAEVVKTAYPDHTALDPNEQHYDPKATPEKPIWEMVDIRLVRKFPASLGLEELRAVAALQKMELLRRGSRLSVQPVTAAEWKAVEKLADKKAKG